MRNENAFSGNKPNEEFDVVGFQKKIADAMVRTGRLFLNPPTFQPGDLVQPSTAFSDEAHTQALPGVVLVFYPDLSVITEDPEDKNVPAYQITRIADDDELLFERVTLPAYQMVPYTGPRPDGA